ncbi:hypothetical protein ACFX13_020410 [Malus domestica]
MLLVVRQSSDWFVARTDNRTNHRKLSPKFNLYPRNQLGSGPFLQQENTARWNRGLPGRSDGRFGPREKLQISTVRITHEEKRSGVYCRREIEGDIELMQHRDSEA